MRNVSTFGSMLESHRAKVTRSIEIKNRVFIQVTRLGNLGNAKLDV